MSPTDAGSDEELVRRAQRAPDGDLRAFEGLVERHQAGVKANCRYLSGTSVDAEDLAQEVFIKAYFGLPRFEGRAQFKTWIQRIKVNHCLNFLKRRQGKAYVDVDDPGIERREEMQVDATAEQVVDAQRLRARIGRVLAAMSTTLRIPLVMRDMDDFSYQEIADELGIGLSAVKMRIKRGREEFRRLFEEASEEAEATASEAAVAGDTAPGAPSGGTTP